MAEKIASLKKKGETIPSNLFFWSGQRSNSSTSWTDSTINSPAVNSTNATAPMTMLDPKFGHIDNGTIVVDMAIPKAFVSGRAYSGNNGSGSAVYGGVRVLINGTLLTGATCYGSSSDSQPYFTRIQTSFAVGDIITMQTRTSAANSYAPKMFMNIVTDD